MTDNTKDTLMPTGSETKETVTVTEAKIALIVAIQALTPHEVKCRCGRGETFEWVSHLPECPRHEVGSMLDSFTKSFKAALDQETKEQQQTTEPETGAELITAERQRQIEAEGWTPEHDDQHDHWELSKAAVGYLGAPGVEWSGVTGVHGGRTPLGWPFKPEDFKPTGDAVRDLVKAGALIAAEIDRLKRLEDIR